MDNRPIGVFDSGLGGLTAVKELEKVLPGESLVYFGDTGRVPYGTKGREVIRRYARQDMDFLLRHGVKAVLAACGTVSSAAADIGAGLPVPYFDVVAPTARAAVRATENRRIGVLGTSATIHSGSYVKAIGELDGSIEVFPEACPRAPCGERLYLPGGRAGAHSGGAVSLAHARGRGGHGDTGLHPLPASEQSH